MGVIELKNIRLYAYHGCLEEEAKIGQDYIVDVLVNTDLSKASENDSLSETIDYSDIYDIVKSEMAVRSKLIESVGNRIAQKIKDNWTSIESLSVTVRKPQPPIGGEVEEVSITVTA
ncbi:MAG: dihydroneopterin aldolase [Flavobacteriales bacterium]|nr:dihydroneopterin aldolase [Flavobacteriales bacterium]